ncbi:MAG: ATP-binding protein, partial [Armatimonadota bacterium]|nr:ATP-binding protein [Armatimonadota bacterium]
DGLVEATRNLTEGLRRLMGVVGDQARAPGGQAAAAIQHALLRHEEARDDVAVVVLRVQPIVLDGLRLTLPAKPSAVRIARQAVSRLAAEAGLDRRQMLGVQVAVSEAVSNIIEHAYGPAGGPIHLRASLAEGLLTVEVRDVGRWRTPREEGRGRGLALMRALADRVTIERGETGTTVRVDIALTGAGARPADP